ncbi:hypothetical protein [Amycolatopsis sp. NBC_00438]|uniref:hypothetical protein n=1 Tax=Amycolatopsis sp. NBC_00438 TaxID=2903558 RepID=UPI002E1AAD78
MWFRPLAQPAAKAASPGPGTPPVVGSTLDYGAGFAAPCTTAGTDPGWLTTLPGQARASRRVLR